MDASADGSNLKLVTSEPIIFLNENKSSNGNEKEIKFYDHEHKDCFK